MDKLRAIKLKHAIETLNSSLVYLDEFELKEVNSIITKYSDELDSYVKSNLDPVDLSKKEQKYLHTALLKRICSKFNDTSIGRLLHNVDYYPECEMHRKMESNPNITDQEYWDSLKKCKECKSRSDAYYSIESKYWKYKEILNKHIHSTILPKELIEAKALLVRRTKGYQMQPLEKQLNEYLTVQAVNHFNNQNQYLINKYNL